MVQIKLNGEARDFDTRPSIVQLLEELGVPRSAVAVEVNRKIVPRSEHDEFRLRDGDEVEVVTFVGGG